LKLVIAEKPSVAMSLAAVLGATERKDGYLEGSGYLVSWCVGHLLELAQPEAYKEQYAKWRYEDLPILPENWKYEVPKDKKTQLALLCRLMKDKRVDSVVCATDAGREGELIFRLVYEYAGCNKPMERLWISSMEDAAIREGFDRLRPGSDYDKLYDAAVCRAGADWLIGINATRLFSVLYGVTLNVGRVMSPTLALLVQRESDIESFISKPFYVPEITCGGFTASGEKMTERSEAEKIRMDCDHNSAFVRSVEKQVKTIGLREAAVKLAEDFGLNYDSRQKPSVRPRIREPTPEQKYQKGENHCYKVLTDYFHLLREWEKKYAPKQPDEEWNPLFAEALYKKNYIEYLLDILLYGSLEERKALVAEQRKEVLKLEQRIAELSADRTMHSRRNPKQLRAERER